VLTKRFGSTGFDVSVIGQGTWPLPDVAALRRGIDLGMTHVDTAEMYGDGRSEEMVGEAIAPYARESLFIVTKVLPSNATRAGVVRACERSLQRLHTEYVDCFLLHWRGEVAIEETMAGLADCVISGKARSIGVSNLDPWDLREASAALPSGVAIACNQVLYNLDERSPEAHELPWARQHASAFVAYTPLARDKTTEGEAVLREIAATHRVTMEAIALAFLARDPLAFVIPKANAIAHVETNASAGEVTLEGSEIAAIERAFPARPRIGALPTN